MDKKYTPLERKKIFEEELNKMLNHQYLTHQQARAIHRMYETFLSSVYGSQLLKQEAATSQEQQQSNIEEKSQQEPAIISSPEKHQPMKEMIAEQKIEQKTSSSTAQSNPIQQQSELPLKPKKSPEKIRERNITWSLMIGVIMILISGLVVATSNWDTMSALSKTLSIGLVAALFFVTSYIADRFLKIAKTAFAFLVLGSLFLPIVVLAIGFYQLLGQWLSVEGDGKYILGLITTLTCLPIYIRNAMKHDNRLFVWLTYITSTVGVGFFLAAFYPPIDLFYLGIMLFNGLLLVAYHRLKNHKSYVLFTKQLPIFAQTNLIISTLLMLAFFENEVAYGFNILLTAVLYLAMIFVYHSRNYHFVFTALIVYGIYQLIENSFLQSIDLFLYAIVGLLYLGLQLYYNNHAFLKKTFQWTSAIISFFAFIYISIQGILIRAEEPTIIMFFAYLVIAMNYLYLAEKTNYKLFRILSPLFIAIAGLQSWRIFHAKWNWSADFFEAYLYGIAFIMFYFIYYQYTTKWFRTIRKSSFILSLFMMYVAIFISVIQWEWLILSFLLLASCLTTYLIYKKTKQSIALWVFNGSLAGSMLSFYDVISVNFSFYGETLRLPFHFALVGVGMLALSFVWEKQKTKGVFSHSAFVIGQTLYSIGLLLLLTTYPFYANEIHIKYITPILLLGGIIVYIILAKRVNSNHIYGLVAFVSLCLYYSLVFTFDIQGISAYTYYSMFAPVILIGISEFVGKRYLAIRPYYFWLSHIILPFHIAFTLIVYYLGGDTYTISPYLFLIPLTLYIYSTLMTKREWAKKLFLYATFFILPFLLHVFFHFYELDGIRTFIHILIATSIILLGVWILVPNQWKRRTDFYLLPFLLFTIMNMNLDTYDPFFNFAGLSIGFTIVSLYLFHRRKWDWFISIPLLLSLFLWQDAPYSPAVVLGILMSCSLVLMVVGRWKYNYLLSTAEKIEEIKLDMYSIFSLIYILFTWREAETVVATHFLFDILKDLSAPVLLTLLLSQQIRRVHKPITQLIIKTLALLSGLIIYYIVIGNFSIHPLWTAELNTLPWILLTIVLSKKVWVQHKGIMKNLQLAVLLIVAAVLVSDALDSNTIYDAIIVGTLSITSLIAGMHYKIKSYFFVGAGVLLLNLMLQTRPFWGNLPWWFYLLIGGITLIGLASFYEWQKQRVDQDGNNLLQRRRNKLLQAWKEWN